MHGWEARVARFDRRLPNKNEGRVSRKVIPDPGLVLLQLGVDLLVGAWS